jgi:hypothetical protein
MRKNAAAKNYSDFMEEGRQKLQELNHALTEQFEECQDAQAPDNDSKKKLIESITQITTLTKQEKKLRSIIMKENMTGGEQMADDTVIMAFTNFRGPDPAHLSSSFIPELRL